MITIIICMLFCLRAASNTLKTASVLRTPWNHLIIPQLQRSLVHAWVLCIINYQVSQHVHRCFIMHE